MVWLVVKPQLDGVGCVVFASFRLTAKCLLTPFGGGRARRNDAEWLFHSKELPALSLTACLRD
ncbi:hypothetical protein Galf_0843 [Gallionella capsiferriformans ES-2]|uniref:Uncharacterized protein n=1 Tax=Gallionella capsiferriformans (strain ES-2) TaxID=395494 RepID=D9SEA3_GALCS|nr:hypothetical protein Galf_0843 [Gallionella capsiferriformans ES-2]